MKKIVCLILTLSLIFTLASCANHDDSAVIEEAKRLIEKSIVLNEIYWGEGIAYLEDYSYSEGYYFPASAISLKKYGIETLNDLKNLTLETFSADYAESIFKGAFLEYNTEMSGYVFPRYYQKYDDAEGKEPKFIMVYSNFEPFLNDTVEYLYDTVKIERYKGKAVFLSIEANVTRGEKTQKRTVSFKLIKEKDEYKIDTPTYITYNDVQE